MLHSELSILEFGISGGIEIILLNVRVILLNNSTRITCLLRLSSTMYVPYVLIEDSACLRLFLYIYIYIYM